MLVILEGEMVMTKIMAHRRRERERLRDSRERKERKGEKRGALVTK